MADDKAKALQLIELAEDEWEETWGTDVPKADEDRVQGHLDVAYRCAERDDWTGAWLAAGNALGFLRDCLQPRLTQTASVG